MKPKIRISSVVLFVAITFSSFGQGIVLDAGSCIKIETGTVMDIATGDLIISSASSGDASLIDLGSVTYSGGGEAKIERTLTKGSWHLIAMPVSSAVSGMFQNDYLLYHSEATNEWAYITSIDHSLNVMQGYSLWAEGPGETSRIFSGITNTGNQSFSFTQAGDGFNLTGNPYPSVLDWDAVSIPAELSGAIWLFDPTIGANGDYTYYISGGGPANTSSQYIPSGQGFFVRAIGGSGNLNLTNDARTHGGQTFYKNSHPNTMLLLKAVANNISSQTAIRFNNESTQGIDRLFDVQKIDSESADLPKIYTICENKKMAINTLPQIQGNETIPLFFETGFDGTYQIIASEIESLSPEIPVYLEDVALSINSDLRLDPEYSFDYTAGTVRQFNIHFRDITAIQESIATEAAFDVKLMNGKLYISYAGKDTFSGPAPLVVYNLAGQKVMQLEITDTYTELDFNKTAGMYIVNINYNDRHFSSKLIQQ